MSTNANEEVIELIYDTEARALERLAETFSKEEVDNLTETFFSPSIDNKRMAWGILYGMNIDQQLRDDVIAWYMANCDPTTHYQDMFITFVEARNHWGKK